MNKLLPEPRDRRARPLCLPHAGRGSSRLAILATLAWLVVSPPSRVGAENAGIVVISEIMYHPAGGGQDLEYIELFNNTPAPVDLSDWTFSRGIRFTFPAGTLLEGKRYLVVCADEIRVREAYGIVNTIGDWCDGAAANTADGDGCALDNGGETIELAESNGVVHARVRYNDRGKWPAAADGMGHSLELLDTYRDPDDPDHWAASLVCRVAKGEAGAVRQGGTPGQPNRASEVPPEHALLHLNEAHLRTPGERWIELFNAGDAPVDLAGYVLTTDRALSNAATLPAESVIEPHGWRTFTEDELGIPFAASADATEADPDAATRWFIALVAPDGSRVVDARIFEPSSEERSEARIPDGSRHVSACATPTPGARNRTDAETRIVIHEIMYHPPDDRPEAEFVELLNRGPGSVDLTGWRFTRGIRFAFGARSLDSGETLVVARHPDAIREAYALPASRVVGPAPDNPDAISAFGRLSNDGERIALCDARGNIVDAVRYHDGGDWPAWCDGGGSSLELIDPSHDNGIAAAWDASDDAGKSEAQRFEYEACFGGGEPELHLALLDRGITLVDDLAVRERTRSVETRGTLVAARASWRYFKVTRAPSATADGWTQIAFDDTAWPEGPAPFGYGVGDEATPLDDMRGAYPSVCFRKTFQVDDPAAIAHLVLDITVDDGFTAYLNATRIARVNLPDGANDLTALARDHVDAARELVDVTAFRDALTAGTNVLSIVVHNASLASSDFAFDAHLVDGTVIHEDGPNLIPGGDFERPLTLDRPDVGAWTLQGTHAASGRTTREPITGAASLKIVASGKGDNKVNRIESALPLLTRNQRVVVSFRARWIVGSRGLLTHGYQGYDLARSHRLAIPTRLGTPGAVNSATLALIDRTGEENAGPVLHALHRHPAVPRPDEDVEVSVGASDTDGIAFVTLRWSLEAPAEPGSDPLHEIPMAGPDRDGRYRAVVPGQPAGTCVVLHVVSEDGAGRRATYPVQPVDRAHPSILDPDHPGLRDTRTRVYRHESPTASTGLSYRFWLNARDEAYLDARPLHSQDLVEGTLVVDERDVYPGARIRFAGSPFARTAWEGSYRVAMPKDRPLWDGIKRFNLEEHQGGGATDGRERISHYLIRHLQGATRVPFATAWLARWRVGDRVDQLREHTAAPDSEFLQRWYPGDDDGAFFEMNLRHTFTDAGSNDTSQDARLHYPPHPRANMAPDDKELYRWFFTLRQDEDADAYDPLIAFARLMTPSVTPDDAFDARIWDAMHVEEFVRVWAVRMNTDDWDAWGCRRGKNCYLYRPPRDGRWVMLPWDMELTYASLDAFRPPPIAEKLPNAFPEVERLLNRPRVKRLYYGVLQELLDGPFDAAFLAPYLDALERAGVERTDVGRPGGYIDQRRQRLTETLHDAVYPQVRVEITTHGGAAFETAATPVPLEGHAPVDVARVLITVDNEPTDSKVVFSDRDPLGFDGVLPLTEGRHRVEVLGFDARGHLVDSDAIEITVTPPSGHAAQFLRGDVDGSGHLTIRDAVLGLLHLFGGQAIPCRDAADADDDGRVSLSDAVTILRYLFQRGPPPPAPFPHVGTDPTEDGLGCGKPEELQAAPDRAEGV